MFQPAPAGSSCTQAAAASERSRWLATLMATVWPQRAADSRSSIRSRPRSRIITPTAKSVIWLFMEGGPSHIDLFDPKPELEKLAGQPMPESFGSRSPRWARANNTLMPSQRTWKQHGQSGIWVSDWYPHIAEHVDDISRDPLLLGRRPQPCRLGLPDEHRLDPRRPAVAGRVGHLRAGHANQNLPAFVVLTDDTAMCSAARRTGAPASFPAVYQGTQFRREATADPRT